MRDGGRVRIVVGDDERIGCCDHVHGAERGAESGDGDVDGDVGERWDEVGDGNDHDYGGIRTGGSRDDFTEGDGIGAESIAGADGNGVE